MHKPHGATFHIIQLSVGGQRVESGQPIELTYGDRSGGSLGTRVQMVAREVSFPTFVASGHEPRFLERFAAWGRATQVATLRAESAFAPTLRVVGGPAASFHLVAPMEVGPDAEFTARLSVLDEACNAATGYEGKVAIRSSDPQAKDVRHLSLDSPGTEIDGLRLNSPGFHRLYALDPNRNLMGVSHPIRVTENPTSIRWGEIHGHSQNSDGNGTPDEHYTYARDTALLDFASVCDHDRGLEANPERWDQAQQKAQHYNDPGRFVALLSYEARTFDPEENIDRGDLNVYYREGQGEMLGKLSLPLDPADTGKQDVLLVPHTPLYGGATRMGTRWEDMRQMPAEIMPLVEIFSTHGNSEYYDCPRHVLWQTRGEGVLDAWKRGFRLGVIGSSDYHEVPTGSLLRIQDTPRTMNNRHMQARCGLAAVRSEELTRDGLFEAMKARRTYATSGIRAYLDFSVNGRGMGGKLTLDRPAQPRHLKMAVATPERIEKLEVVRNGETIAELADGNWWREADLTDEEPIPDGAFYYLRITTEREDLAWTSPVWVGVAAKN
jgi:hypothetical protein